MSVAELGLDFSKLSAEQLAEPEVKELLAELDRVLEANPLERYNNPLLPKYHRKQMEFNRIKPPPLGVKALIAANRTGKTIGCRADDVIQAVPGELVPEHLRECKKWEPPFHVWIGAPKYAKHEDTTLPLLRKFIPQAVLPEGNFGKAYNSQSRMVRLTCGSTIGLKTYDQDLDAWASAEVHRISWDEEPDSLHAAELRSEARARLISTGGEELIGTTPLLGYSWLYDDVWLKRDQPNISVVHMRMADNPWLTSEIIKEFAAGLTEDERRMRIDGEFVHVGGLVYPQLAERHFVGKPSREHVQGQEIFVGIDPGVNTTAVVFIAFDRENHALVFDELYLHDNQAIPEHASRAIREKLALWDVQPKYFLIDPSARNRSLTDAQRVQELYRQAGIMAHAAQNDRETGVFEVRRRLEFDLILISKECRKLRWELERYRQDPKPDGRFDVVKEDDHGADALRYVSMAHPLPVGFRAPSTAKPPEVYVPGTAPPQQLQTEGRMRPLGAAGLKGTDAPTSEPRPAPLPAPRLLCHEPHRRGLRGLLYGHRPPRADPPVPEARHRRTGRAALRDGPRRRGRGAESADGQAEPKARSHQRHPQSRRRAGAAGRLRKGLDMASLTFNPGQGRTFDKAISTIDVHKGSALVTATDDPQLVSAGERYEAADTADLTLYSPQGAVVNIVYWDEGSVSPPRADLERELRAAVRVRDRLKAEAGEDETEANARVSVRRAAEARVRTAEKRLRTFYPDSAELEEQAPRGDTGGSGGGFESRTVDELRKLAAERDIPGRSGMNKAELIGALRS